MRSRHEPRRAGQEGDGKLGAVVAVVVLVLAIHVGLKYIPARISAAEFTDYVEDQLAERAANIISDEEFFELVTAKAAELGLDVGEEDIELESQTGRVAVKIQYEQVLGMLWGDWTLNQEVDLDRPKL